MYYESFNTYRKNSIMKYLWAVRKVKMKITEEKVTVYQLANFSIHFCIYVT